MRWVYYFVAVVATALACLLWLFVFGRFSGASSVPSAAPVTASLPVVPVLRPAPASTAPSDERFMCVAGYVARQRGNTVETLLVENKPVACR